MYVACVLRVRDVLHGIVTLLAPPLQVICSLLPPLPAQLTVYLSKPKVLASALQLLGVLADCEDLMDEIACAVPHAIAAFTVHPDDTAVFQAAAFYLEAVWDDDTVRVRLDDSAALSLLCLVLYLGHAHGREVPCVMRRGPGRVRDTGHCACTQGLGSPGCLSTRTVVLI